LIRVDPDLRARVGLDEELIGQMAEALEADKGGVVFPPVDVFYDGTDLWLADGFYRYHAHVKAGKTKIRVNEHRGTREDAALFACGANKEHDVVGLRRTNADKRLAVEKTLKLKPGWTGGRVALHCGVTAPFANKVRRELEQPGQQGPGQEPPGTPGLSETVSDPSPAPAGGASGEPATRVGTDGKTYRAPRHRRPTRDNTKDIVTVALKFAKADHARWKEMVKLAMKDLEMDNESDAVLRVLEHYTQERGRS
jgi:hypothetical protein